MLARTGHTFRRLGRSVNPTRRAPGPHILSRHAWPEHAQCRLWASKSPSAPGPYPRSPWYLDGVTAGPQDPAPVSSTRRELSQMSVESARKKIWHTGSASTVALPSRWQYMTCGLRARCDQGRLSDLRSRGKTHTAPEGSRQSETRPTASWISTLLLLLEGVATGLAQPQRAYREQVGQTG